MTVVTVVIFVLWTELSFFLVIFAEEVHDAAQHPQHRRLVMVRNALRASSFSLLRFFSTLLASCSRSPARALCVHHLHRFRSHGLLLHYIYVAHKLLLIQFVPEIVTKVTIIFKKENRRHIVFWELFVSWRIFEHFPLTLWTISCPNCINMYPSNVILCKTFSQRIINVLRCRMALKVFACVTTNYEIPMPSVGSVNEVSSAPASMAFVCIMRTEEKYKYVSDHEMMGNRSVQ